MGVVKDIKGAEMVVVFWKVLSYDMSIRLCNVDQGALDNVKSTRN